MGKGDTVDSAQLDNRHLYPSHYTPTYQVLCQWENSLVLFVLFSGFCHDKRIRFNASSDILSIAKISKTCTTAI